MQLGSRKLHILHAVVHDYISYGEPAGSRTIAKNTTWVSALQP